MAEGGYGLTNTPGWRMALLVLFFALISWAVDLSLHQAEKWLRKRKMKGLLHALNALKMELLLVGVISLVLTMFEDYLAQICFNPNGSEEDLKYCGEGETSLWPITAQHEVHGLIFSVAITHIVFVTITVVSALWRITKWRQWESQCRNNSKVAKVSVSWLYGRMGTNPTWHFCCCLFGQFSYRLDFNMYHNIRLLFIEQMGFNHDFNFYALVRLSMEEEITQVIETSWLLWVCCAFVLAIPYKAYTLFWLHALMWCIMLAVGAKIMSIIIYLTAKVVLVYGEDAVFGRMGLDPSHPQKPSRPTLHRLSLGTWGSRPPHPKAPSNAPEGLKFLYRRSVGLVKIAKGGERGGGAASNASSATPSTYSPQRPKHSVPRSLTTSSVPLRAAYPSSSKGFDPAEVLRNLKTGWQQAGGGSGGGRGGGGGGNEDLLQSNPASGGVGVPDPSPALLSCLTGDLSPIPGSPHFTSPELHSKGRHTANQAFDDACVYENAAHTVDDPDLTEATPLSNGEDRGAAAASTRPMGSTSTAVAMGHVSASLGGRGSTAEALGQVSASLGGRGSTAEALGQISAPLGGRGSAGNGGMARPASCLSLASIGEAGESPPSSSSRLGDLGLPPMPRPASQASLSSPEHASPSVIANMPLPPSSSVGLASLARRASQASLSSPEHASSSTLANLPLPPSFSVGLAPTLPPSSSVGLASPARRASQVSLASPGPTSSSMLANVPLPPSFSVGLAPTLPPSSSVGLASPARRASQVSLASPGPTSSSMLASMPLPPSFSAGLAPTLPPSSSVGLAPTLPPSSSVGLAPTLPPSSSAGLASPGPTFSSSVSMPAGTERRPPSVPGLNRASMGRIAKFLEMTEQQQEEHTLSSRAYAKDLHTRSVGSPSVGFYRSSAESGGTSASAFGASAIGIELGRKSPSAYPATSTHDNIATLGSATHGLGLGRKSASAYPAASIPEEISTLGPATNGLRLGRKSASAYPAASTHDAISTLGPAANGLGLGRHSASAYPAATAIDVTLTPPSGAHTAQSSSVPTQASGRQSPFGVTSVQVAGGGTASPTLGSTLHALLANVPNIHTTPKNSTEMPHLAHTPSKRIRKGKAPARGHPISSCMGCFPELPGKVARTKSEVVGETLIKFQAAGLTNNNTSELFWFKKPKFITHLFQLVYFENSLAMAMTCWALTRDWGALEYETGGHWVFAQANKWAAGLLFAVCFMLILYCAMQVLPLFALLLPLGSHCPEEVLRQAVKQGLAARQAALLARAMNVGVKNTLGGFKSSKDGVKAGKRKWRELLGMRVQRYKGTNPGPTRKESDDFLKRSSVSFTSIASKYSLNAITAKQVLGGYLARVSAKPRSTPTGEVTEEGHPSQPVQDFNVSGQAQGTPQLSTILSGFVPPDDVCTMISELKQPSAPES